MDRIETFASSSSSSRECGVSESVSSFVRGSCDVLFGTEEPVLPRSTTTDMGTGLGDLVPERDFTCNDEDDDDGDKDDWVPLPIDCPPVVVVHEEAADGW